MSDEVTTTAETATQMGLSAEEFDRICTHLDRKPNRTELGVFSAMWSEHCSYKSTRHWLKTLPTEGDCVIQGPGENAGVVDIGDGWAVVFKIESHNHPSFIEPYQGAATGVGGILRDIFTMGARPIALLNALRFGAPDHPLTRHLVSGVVAGIGGYGNCIGIPTVGGELGFDACYNSNILVNAMAVGIAPKGRIFYSAASGVGNPVYYIGAKTGRDGIHGAVMASTEFNDGEGVSQRPTVQVGDPLAGKLLLEASLELMAADCIIAIQDMGAAGLTSSSVEMAAKGGLGMELNLDFVPVREANMTAYELMLSESQERMLAILNPDTTDTAKEILAKWDLDCAEIGRLTDSGRLVLTKGGETTADLPLAPLVNDAPLYERNYETPKKLPVLATANLNHPPIAEALLKLIGSHHLASRRWVWEQYDRHVMADTIAASGGDAALVRVHNTDKAIAITTDCTPRYVAADAEIGAMQAVAEAFRNICAIGAKPLAITNNLNFGNPEKPRVMGQIVGAIKGIGQAAEVLDTPVVSGNVSLYNETDGVAIAPTPVIGMVGVMEQVSQAVGIALNRKGLKLFVVGQDETVSDGWLGCSIYADVVVENTTQSAPPPIDLAMEKAHGAFIRAAIRTGSITAAHDIGDGGLLVAVAEMALAGSIGAEITLPNNSTASGSASGSGWCFGEDQGRFVVATSTPAKFKKMAQKAGVALAFIGTTGGKALTLSNGATIALKDLHEAHEKYLPNLMQTPYHSEEE